MNSNEFKSKYVKDGKILPNDVDKIDGSLDLSGNNISKIENLPDKIEEGLYLSDNKISKIENLPDKIEGSLFLRNNKISKIENLPDKIEGHSYLDDNPLPKRYRDKSFDELKKIVHKEKVLDKILLKT